MSVASRAAVAAYVPPPVAVAGPVTVTDATASVVLALLARYVGSELAAMPVTAPR